MFQQFQAISSRSSLFEIISNHHGGTCFRAHRSVCVCVCVSRDVFRGKLCRNTFPARDSFSIELTQKKYGREAAALFPSDFFSALHFHLTLRMCFVWCKSNKKKLHFSKREICATRKRNFNWNISHTNWLRGRVPFSIIMKSLLCVRSNKSGNIMNGKVFAHSVNGNVFFFSSYQNLGYSFLRWLPREELAIEFTTNDTLRVFNLKSCNNVQLVRRISGKFSIRWCLQKQLLA